MWKWFKNYMEEAVLGICLFVLFYLIKFFSMLKIDKVAHFGLGGMITACMALLSILQEPLSTASLLLCPFIGHVCVFILSVLKEYIVDNEINWIDILAAMLGSAVVHVVVGVGVLFGL